MKQPGFEHPTLFPDLATSGPISGAEQFDPTTPSKDIAAGAAQRLPADPGNGSPARVGEIGDRKPITLSPNQQAAIVEAGMVKDPAMIARVQAHRTNALLYGIGGPEVFRHRSDSEREGYQTGMAAVRAAGGKRPRKT